MKVVFVFDHFGPYHLARVAAVASLPDLTVMGVELHAKSRTYGWEQPERFKNLGFEIVSLPEVNSRGLQERRALRPALEEALHTCEPDVVFVNGWGDFMSLETISWVRRRDCRLIVMSETRRSDGVRSAWSEWIKGRVVRLCDAGLCGGESHRAYLRDLDLPNERVFLGYNAVDNECFAESRSGSASCKSPYFLASNRFVERKNLTCLIQAYARYVKNSQCSAISAQEASGEGIWPLVLLGDGELRGELEESCHGLGISVTSDFLNRDTYKLNDSPKGGLVVFAGFRQIDELLEFYARAGAFVHPALAEPWGLVINEAMASGLPILSSNNVGAAEELLKEGINGFSFDPQNVEELARALMRMAELPPSQRESMGIESKKIISQWGPERFAQGAHEAIQKSMSHPPQCLGMLDRLMLEILIRK